MDSGIINHLDIIKNVELVIFQDHFLFFIFFQQQTRLNIALLNINHGAFCPRFETKPPLAEMDKQWNEHARAHTHTPDPVRRPEDHFIFSAIATSVGHVIVCRTLSRLHVTKHYRECPNTCDVLRQDRFS